MDDPHGGRGITPQGPPTHENLVHNGAQHILRRVAEARLRQDVQQVPRLGGCAHVRDGRDFRGRLLLHSRDAAASGQATAAENGRGL